MPQSIIDEMRQSLTAAKLEARKQGWIDGRQDGSRNPIPPQPPNPAATVLIGTHHKCGTVWMQQVFSRVAELTGRRFFDVSPKLVSSEERDHIIAQEIESTRGSILFEYETRFPAGLSADQCRGLHMVRDPRDMLVSATDYHAWADEPWLHEPLAELGGNTYQQTLNALENREAKQLFELTNGLENSIAEPIKRMLAFDPSDVFRTERYEDLIADQRLERWHQIALHLGFAGRELPLVLRAVWEKSIFGDLHPQGRQRAHIQSGGKTERWKADLTKPALEALEARFGQSLDALGYD